MSFDLPVVNTPFQLLVVCLRYLLASKTQRFESDISCCSNIYKSLLTYFRLGDDDGNTISWLCKYRQYTFNHGNALDDFYVDLLYVVVVFAMQKSAWSLLPQHSGITVDVWRSYLDRREAVKILWQSQELLCTHGVLRGNNAIVELPTGVGKTKSIELIIRAAQLSNRAREVIIVAPLRALCNEITHDLQCAFRKDDVEINRFSDVLEDDYSFDLLSNDSIRISICTPEKLNYIIHHQPEICDMVGLFVLDEAHMFDDGIRGITYEFLVTTIRERLNENQQLVLLSAVMTNADDIKRWLFGENGVLATDEKIVSTPKSVGFCNASNIAYYSGDPLTWDYFVPLDIVTHELQLFGRERKLRVFPQGNSSQDIALYYGIRLCRNGGVAVYVDKTASVRKTIERAVDIQKRGYSLNNIVDNSDISEMEKLQYLISKYYGKDHVYTVGCCNGILPHHSKLPNGVKLAVEHALREKMARFVICTSTLAQGVNIPIKYLLMTSVNQRNSHAKVRSFQNLIGRTARAGMYTEGSILITDPTLYERRNTYLLSEENEQWGMPLLTSMYLGFGTCYTDSDLNRMILPPALDLNGKQSLYAEMSILAVNAASKNAEVATRFVEFCAENLSNTVRYEMEPALNEPVESSAYYVRVAELQGKINDLAEQLEKADQDARYAIKEKIIQAEAKLEQLEERKWEIDPKSIEIYRSAAENLKVSYKSPLLLKGENGGYEALRSVVDKYCTQDFSDSDINALIAELDRVATMVYLESL